MKVVMCDYKGEPVSCVLHDTTYEQAAIAESLKLWNDDTARLFCFRVVEVCEIYTPPYIEESNHDRG